MFKNGTTYGNVDLTIAATTATDSYAHFFGVRNNRNPRNSCKLTYQDKQQLPAGEVMIEYIRNDGERLRTGFRNVLNQRGWTLQEWALSSRLLSFSKDKIFWECNANRRLESLHFMQAEDRSRFRLIKQDLKALDSSNVYRWLVRNTP